VGLLRPIALRLLKMQDPKLLTLRSHSVDPRLMLILGNSHDVVRSTVPKKGGRYFDYSTMWSNSLLIFDDERPKIVDTLLTLIFRA